jgi:hypothetical protein
MLLYMVCKRINELGIVLRCIVLRQLRDRVQHLTGQER